MYDTNPKLSSSQNSAKAIYRQSSHLRSLFDQRRTKTILVFETAVENIEIFENCQSKMMKVDCYPVDHFIIPRTPYCQQNIILLSNQASQE